MMNLLTFQTHFVILCSVIVLRKLAKPVTGGEPAGTPLFYIMEMVYMQKMLDFIT